MTWLIYSNLVDSLSDDPYALRELFLLADDKDNMAALDRKTMGQAPKVEVTDVRPRHG